MERRAAQQHTLAGLLFGAGIALFLLFLLSSAVPVRLEEGQTARSVLGVVGVSLWVAGLLLGQRLRRRMSVADAEPGAASDPPRAAGR